MIWLTGLLSFIQMVFLPGFVIVKNFSIGNGWLNKLVFCFAFSLIFNHFMVVGLTTLKIYQPLAVYVFVLLELILLAIGYRKASASVSTDEIERTSFEILQELWNEGRFWNKALIVMALGTVIYFTLGWIKEFGTIFMQGDAVVSWNRWAVDWYSNMFARHTWHYPQLIPTVWSVSYKMMGRSDIQFFAKAIMPLFIVIINIMLVDLGIRHRGIHYFMAAPIVSKLFDKVFGSGLFEGYVDVAVAFFSFTAVYVLLDTKKLSGAGGKKMLIVGAVLCGGAALTKQAGLFMLLLYPVLAYYLFIREGQYCRQEKLKVIGLVIAIMLVFVAPWYIYKEVQIAHGLDQSEVQYVTNGIYNGLSYTQRFVAAVAKATFVSVLLCISLIFFGKLDSSLKKLLLLIGLPYFLIWAIFYGYDSRNVSVALPIIGLSTSFIINNYLQNYFNSTCFNRKFLKYLCASVVILLIGIGAVRFNDGKMIATQYDKQKQLGDSSLNGRMYEYKNNHGFKGLILTDYQFLIYLPDLRDNTVFSQFYKSADELQSDIDRLKPVYLLISRPPVNSDYYKFIFNRVAVGKYTLIFEKDDFLFIEIRERD